MEKRTRQVDAKGRTTLFPDFAGATVVIERLSPSQVVVRKIRAGKRKYSLTQLVGKITARNRHGEISTGKPVGGEAW